MLSYSKASKLNKILNHCQFYCRELQRHINNKFKESINSKKTLHIFDMNFPKSVLGLRPLFVRMKFWTL